MILSFDPGVSTGVAVLGNDGSIWETKVFRSLDDLKAFCSGVVPKTDDEIHVVAEEGPKQSSNYRAHIQDVEEVIKSFFSDITWVPPGQWKGHPAATSLGVNATQHEKDAVGLGRWFRKTKLIGTNNAA